jgi:hypothetical protein
VGFGSSSVTRMALFMEVVTRFVCLFVCLFVTVQRLCILGRYRRFKNASLGKTPVSTQLNSYGGVREV